MRWSCVTVALENFLNFVMEPRLRPHAGMDLFQLYQEKAVGRSNSVKAQWERMMMGLAPSPYFVTKDMLVVKMMTKGSNIDSSNVNRWAAVRLNLPGMDIYDQTLPWVFKYRKDGSIAADIFIYIDDGRPLADTAWENWNAARKFRCILNCLGLQDDYRKRIGPSQVPCEWTGTMAETVKKQMSLLIPQNKWDKAKIIIRRIVEELELRTVLNNK